MYLNKSNGVSTSMSKRDYKCINNCEWEEDNSLKEQFGLKFIDVASKFEFRVCAKCGALYPATIKKIKEYHEILQIPPKFEKSLKLLYMSQYESSVREAIIILEQQLQNLSGLENLNGNELISKAFSYQVDSNKNEITTYPKIKINNLSNITEQNEHEGIKLMLMGFFKSVRNIYMHKSVETQIMTSLNLITQISFYSSLIGNQVLVYNK